jgi:hypothetical protein
VWGPVERAMLVGVTFGVVLDGRMPAGEHFPGQPFGFWMSPFQDLVRLRRTPFEGRDLAAEVLPLDGLVRHGGRPGLRVRGGAGRATRAGGASGRSG